MRRLHRIKKRHHAHKTSLRKRARHQKRPHGAPRVAGRVKSRTRKLTLNKAGKWRKRI